MVIVLIVLIITFGIIAYHVTKEPTHITCLCGAEMTSKSDWEIGSFQSYHFSCHTFRTPNE